MIKKIYIYVVSFATLMMSIGGGVSVFNSVANLVAPNTYELSYEDYVQTYKTEYDVKGNPKTTTKGEASYKEDYDAYVEHEEKSEQKRSLNQLIAGFGWIVIPFPIFLYMQRKLREEKEETKKEVKKED